MNDGMQARPDAGARRAHRLAPDGWHRGGVAPVWPGPAPLGTAAVSSMRCRQVAGAQVNASTRGGQT